jgi:hypothetical protein
MRATIRNRELLALFKLPSTTFNKDGLDLDM